MLGLLSYHCGAKSPRTCWRFVATSVLCALVAMLCKEQGLSVIAVCVVYEIVVVQKVIAVFFVGGTQLIISLQITKIMLFTDEFSLFSF